MILVSVVQAKLVPTGRTRFVGSSLATVAGAPGETVTFRARMQMRVKNTKTRKYKWVACPNKRVEWFFYGIRGVKPGTALIAIVRTNKNGLTKINFTIPPEAKCPQVAKYGVKFRGNARLNSCGESGRLEILCP
jgi:hypothetical protein